MRLLIRLAILSGAAYALFQWLRSFASPPPPSPARPPAPQPRSWTDAQPVATAATADPEAVDDPEPVLGYDGMDADTVIPWLEASHFDPATLLQIREYEERTRARERVLEAIDDLIG